MGPPYYSLLLVFAMLCGMGPPYYSLLLVYARLCGMGPAGGRELELYILIYC